MVPVHALNLSGGDTALRNGCLAHSGLRWNWPTIPGIGSAALLPGRATTVMVRCLSNLHPLGRPQTMVYLKREGCKLVGSWSRDRGEVDGALLGPLSQTGKVRISRIAG